MSRDDTERSCPLSQSELIERSFMEYRNRLLDLAAFLDRLDRARELDAGDDARHRALKAAMRELVSAEPGRVERVQMILSDTDCELLEQRDRQSARGAPDRINQGEAQ